MDKIVKIWKNIRVENKMFTIAIIFWLLVFAFIINIVDTNEDEEPIVSVSEQNPIIMFLQRFKKYLKKKYQTLPTH